MPRKTLAERFWKKVDKRGPDECWPWLGYQGGRGYGRFWMDGRDQNATRIMIFLNTGTEVPEELEVCHACDNPSCVNPAHLWIGTHQENMIDASDKGRINNAGITHCKRGHEFTPENTRIRKSNRRSCRKCARMHVTESRKRRRAAGLL